MRKLIALVMVISMVFFLAVCGNAGALADSVEQTYPVTLTDQAGRTVTIEEEPQRLISSYYIPSSVLIALEADEKLVGIEKKADKRAIYSLSAPALTELPQVGTAKELDMEAVMALDPDLLILPMKLKNSVSTLEELGLTVLLVDPEDQQRLMAMIEVVGQATNRNDKAASLLSWISAQRDYLNETLAEVEKPTVYLAGNSDMLKTAGDAMYQADMIRLAGGINAASAIEDTYWAEISYEQLLAWDPEYIILAADATYTVDDVLADPNLADCKAVVNGRVYSLPNNAEAWDSPVPASILGSVWLANILHPEKVTEAESIARINEFYETYYHFTYSEN